MVIALILIALILIIVIALAIWLSRKREEDSPPPEKEDWATNRLYWRAGDEIRNLRSFTRLKLVAWNQDKAVVDVFYPRGEFMVRSGTEVMDEYAYNVSAEKRQAEKKAADLVATIKASAESQMSKAAEFQAQQGL